jgi:predicted TIM-barrel fold metal-dependent hydrolase
MGQTPHWNQFAELNPEERKPLIDFLMHEIVRLAGEIGLVVQIHTGFQEGQGNYISNANPTHLANLFLEYRNTRFDILHCGFPYYLELACLAKNFANVFPNMTWMYCIGNTVAERILSDWLDIIPVSKILGFGGDYHFVEGVYGHAQLARQSVARVLSAKIELALFTENLALEYGKKILNENAERIYNRKEF